MQKMKYIIGVLVLALSVYLFWFSDHTQDLFVKTEVQAPEQDELGSGEEVEIVHLEPKQTLSQLLQESDFSGQDVNAIVEAAKPFYNLNMLSTSTKIEMYRDYSPSTVPTRLQFEIGLAQILRLQRETASSWKAEVLERNVSRELYSFSGEGKSSLWQSAIEAKMDPNLVVNLTEIFAWQLDFNREPRQGDTWRLSVERIFVDGKAVAWGKIIAAEYVNAGRKFNAVQFVKDGVDYGYFDLEGNNLRKMFLKSPIKFGRISSRFTMRRFHPVLKVARPHLGVDYAAPTGTPVHSIGDGVVIKKGYFGGGGNMLHIKHNSSYTTAYKHLSRFASGLKNGSRVRQGQVIAYVGSTGLSTGPHLHFEMYQNGRYTDPLRVVAPAALPIAAADMDLFKQSAQRNLASLPSDDVQSSAKSILSETWKKDLESLTKEASKFDLLKTN